MPPPPPNETLVCTSYMCTFQCKCEYLSIVTGHGELLSIAANSRRREDSSEIDTTPSRQGELDGGKREGTKVQGFR